jgi:biofilm PGA synthesis N-glycosyltransferase PgaC
MWIVALELFASTAWAYAMGTVLVVWILGLFLVLNPPYIAKFPPGWTGVMLGTTCLVQFAVSIAIDSRYETRFGRIYYWMIWYPMVYWMIQMFASIAAVPKALLKKSGRRAIWTSPDRGVRPQS